jgi:hypothetical protein
MLVRVRVSAVQIAFNPTSGKTGAGRPDKVKNNKGTTALIVVLVLLGVAIAGGLFFYIRRKRSQRTVQYGAFGVPSVLPRSPIPCRSEPPGRELMWFLRGCTDARARPLSCSGQRCPAAGPFVSASLCRLWLCLSVRASAPPSRAVRHDRRRRHVHHYRG